MNLLPQTYLLGLVGLLAIVAVVVGRQFLRVRRDEARLIELEKSDTASSRQASDLYELCLLYTSPSPRDLSTSRMPSSA